MQGYIFLCFVMIKLSLAIVCPPNVCDNVQQQPLDCKGGVIKGGGFCGCTDICAKVHGEDCQITSFLGIPNTAVCDEGLTCIPFLLEGSATGHKCVDSSLVGEDGETPLFVSRRGMRCSTPCQRKSLLCTFSMVVYEGQWFAKCDSLGNFHPEQCDNTGHCFCVDRLSGEIQEDSKVLGSANC
ncbi:cystine knot toxin [Plakobranchus ocellatus]|uniref:Cystine knot toxin n=1 Tax=Plakobranchus ocellatus TaxID=259542 RepID=A0AAV4A4L1_9GAST|nr:cystine knot toxin [Plakobranchus ocellatus]